MIFFRSPWRRLVLSPPLNAATFLPSAAIVAVPMIGPPEMDFAAMQETEDAVLPHRRESFLTRRGSARESAELTSTTDWTR